jgi:PKD repeat protein
MADARLGFAAAAAIATLAVLLLVVTRAAPAFAQSQSNQDSQPPQMPAPGSMQAPASMPGHSFDHVDLPQPPSITMTAVPGYGPAPLMVGFFVNTVDPEGKGFVSYVWNFGDGQVSMDPPLTFFHTYQAAGTYVATVNATTADGRTAVAYVGVTVRSGILN